MDARLRGSTGVTTTQTECFKDKRTSTTTTSSVPRRTMGGAKSTRRSRTMRTESRCGCSIGLLHLVGTSLVPVYQPICIHTNYTTSIPKVRGKRPIIRDVAIYRGMPHGLGKLSQFSLPWCKLPCLNSHEIDETG